MRGIPGHPKSVAAPERHCLSIVGGVSLVTKHAVPFGLLGPFVRLRLDESGIAITVRAPIARLRRVVWRAAWADVVKADTKYGQVILFSRTSRSCVFVVFRRRRIEPLLAELASRSIPVERVVGRLQWTFD